MKYKAALIALLVILAFIFIKSLGEMDGPANNADNGIPQTRSQPTKADKNILRATEGAKLLKQNTRNPDSVKFFRVTAMENGAVCYGFRAENGFGGLNVIRAVLSSQDDSILTSEMKGFTSLWNDECANKTGPDVTEIVSYTIK